MGFRRVCEDLPSPLNIKTKMKKNALLLLNILFGIGSMGTVAAQQETCGFEHQQEMYRKTHPHAKLEAENIPDMAKMRAIADYHQGQYVIPVVFHVFGEPTNDSRLKVTYSLIEKALKQTSQDFQGLTADYDQTGSSSRFENIKQPLNVDFRLAKIDPDGNPTKGVVFYDEAEKGFGNGGGYDDAIRKYAWDNSKYMNVYIMKDLYADGDLYNSGVSWLPDNSMMLENLARVVYNGSYIGNNTSENFRRVLTHEFGHFLGLHHTFEGGCDYPNDGIDDTPPVATSKWPADEVNCEGDYTDWENFMNYTDAYRHFTAGQVARMEYYLNESMSRSQLWQEDNLQATGVNNDYQSSPSVLVVKGRNFTETDNNQGEVGGTLQLEATQGLTFARIGTLTAGTDYTITNLPEGLNAVVTFASDVTAIIELEGKAVSHLLADSKKDVTVTLDPSVLKLEGGTAVAQSIRFGVMFNDPYTSYCLFNPRFAPYAHISKVRFAQIERNTDFDGQQYKDFRADYVAGVEKGKTYQLEVTVQNWKSGEGDPYTVRAWFDWNGDFVFQQDEMIAPQKIARIGKAGTEHVLTFDIEVPDFMIENKEVGFRVMMHYTLGNDGEDPCGEIDSGDVEDYGVVVGEDKAHVLPPDGPIEPVDEVCIPEFSYQPYAYIKKVEFAGFSNETFGEVGNTDIIEDFRDNEALNARLEKGKEYVMKVTYVNLNSHPKDGYVLRAYIDWNNNKILEKTESQKIGIPAIGSADTPSTVEFKWKAPEDVVMDQKLHMRVFLHYGDADSMAGELPCGTVENGQLEEYYAIVSTDVTGIADETTAKLNIYPNPTDGILHVGGADVDAQKYQLYSVDGRLVQEGNVLEATIDISSQAKGMYILKIETKDSVIQKMVILK